MTSPASASVLLMAVVREHSLTRTLGGHGYSVVRAPSGTLAIEWARDLRPDVIILEADLPDMSGIDACRTLHSDVRIGRNVPILLLAPGKPSPEQRVAALRAGAWDFLQHPGDVDELTLKLQTYVQAKRNIDDALADGLVDPTTGLHSRPGLARRTRELAALMARTHGALACVVFDLNADPADPRAGTLVAQTARVSDVVGALSTSEFAVLAPGTDAAGALTLARRISGSLRQPPEDNHPPVVGPSLRVGYHAVANLKYAPIDPAEFLARATTAVRTGVPEPGAPWVRRYHPDAAAERSAEPAGRPSPPVGVTLDTRRVRS
jgi:PleD family two-component response regulator